MTEKRAILLQNVEILNRKEDAEKRIVQKVLFGVVSVDRVSTITLPVYDHSVLLDVLVGTLFVVFYSEGNKQLIKPEPIVGEATAVLLFDRED